MALGMTKQHLRSDTLAAPGPVLPVGPAQVESAPQAPCAKPLQRNANYRITARANWTIAVVQLAAAGSVTL